MSRKGYTRFRDIPEDSYFFIAYSHVPCQKASDTHFFEAGCAVRQPIGADTPVVPIVIGYTGDQPSHITVGHHVIALAPSPKTKSLREAKAASHEAYVARRLEAEGGGSKGA